MVVGGAANGAPEEDCHFRLFTSNGVEISSVISLFGCHSLDCVASDIDTIHLALQPKKALYKKHDITPKNNITETSQYIACKIFGPDFQPPSWCQDVCRESK
jgi:hypothetical protein